MLDGLGDQTKWLLGDGTKGRGFVVLDKVFGCKVIVHVKKCDESEFL